MQESTQEVAKIGKRVYKKLKVPKIPKQFCYLPDLLVTIK